VTPRRLYIRSRTTKASLNRTSSETRNRQIIETVVNENQRATSRNVDIRELITQIIYTALNDIRTIRGYILWYSSEGQNELLKFSSHSNDAVRLPMVHAS